jgi:hypothetical protein
LDSAKPVLPVIASPARIPGWAWFDPSSGSIGGTPSTQDVGTYADIRISLSNGPTSTLLVNFTVEVLSSEGSGGVTLEWHPPTVNELAGGSHFFAMTALNSQGIESDRSQPVAVVLEP